MSTCSAEGCERTDMKGHGWCGMHYQRAKKHGGDPLAFMPVRYDPVCTVPTCDRPHHSRGFCSRHCQRFRTHDLDVETYMAMYEAQGGKCAICRQAETQVSGWHGEPMELSIDHDHATGRIRGLLCQWCNQGIGRFRDDPELCTKAADYLDMSRVRG